LEKFKQFVLEVAVLMLQHLQCSNAAVIIKIEAQIRIMFSLVNEQQLACYYEKHELKREMWKVVKRERERERERERDPVRLFWSEAARKATQTFRIRLAPMLELLPMN